jgi:hypothetical protein
MARCSKADYRNRCQILQPCSQYTESDSRIKWKRGPQSPRSLIEVGRASRLRRCRKYARARLMVCYRPSVSTQILFQWIHLHPEANIFAAQLLANDLRRERVRSGLDAQRPTRMSCDTVQSLRGFLCELSSRQMDKATIVLSRSFHCGRTRPDELADSLNRPASECSAHEVAHGRLPGKLR